MEVILKQPVRNLGDTDDLVKVKPGYGRNYLIPQGIAVLATAGNKRALEEKKKQASHKQTHLLDYARQMADKLGSVTLTVEALAGADGKLFGSVTSMVLATKLAEAGYEVDRKHFTHDDMRHLGDYTLTVHLHREVKATIPVSIVRKQD
jgi:large subunit ribosomal protein L9